MKTIKRLFVLASIVMIATSCEKSDLLTKGNEPDLTGKQIISYELFSGGEFPSLTYKDATGHKYITSATETKVINGINWYYKKDTIQLPDTCPIWIEARHYKCLNVKLIVSINNGLKTELQDDCIVLFQKR